MFTSSLLNPDRTPSKQKAFLVGGSLTNCTTTEFLAETAEAPLRIQPRRGDRTLPSAGAPSTPYRQVRVTGGLNGFDFAWPLQPGETLETPPFYGGFSAAGFGPASRMLHRFKIGTASWL